METLRMNWILKPFVSVCGASEAAVLPRSTAVWWWQQTWHATLALVSKKMKHIPRGDRTTSLPPQCPSGCSQANELPGKCFQQKSYDQADKGFSHFLLLFKVLIASSNTSLHAIIYYVTHTHCAVMSHTHSSCSISFINMNENSNCFVINAASFFSKFFQLLFIIFCYFSGQFSLNPYNPFIRDGRACLSIIWREKS